MWNNFLDIPQGTLKKSIRLDPHNERRMVGYSVNHPFKGSLDSSLSVRCSWRSRTHGDERLTPAKTAHCSSWSQRMPIHLWVRRHPTSSFLGNQLRLVQTIKPLRAPLPRARMEPPSFPLTVPQGALFQTHAVAFVLVADPIAD